MMNNTNLQYIYNNDYTFNIEGEVDLSKDYILKDDKVNEVCTLCTTECFSSENAIFTKDTSITGEGEYTTVSTSTHTIMVVIIQ